MAQASDVFRAGLMAVCLICAATAGAGPGLAASDTKAPEASAEEKAGPENLESLKEQLRRLGEIMREMASAAARSARELSSSDAERAGTASIAPVVNTSNLRALYGPEGPTERSVRVVLEHRLLVLGNPLLKAGDVKSSPDGIVAEVVTAKEGALVERFLVDPKTGEWRVHR